MPETDDTDGYAEDYIDPKGEEKIDENGYLKGGRQYRFDVFTLPRHPTRLYLYSMDASKLLGSRDTYAFFIRNHDVTKVIATEEDKEYLKFHNLLPSRYGGRTVSLIIARNLFRVYGHRIIRRGKIWFDDYDVGSKSQPKISEEPIETQVDKVEHMIFNEEFLSKGYKKDWDNDNAESMYRGVPILGYLTEPIEEEDPFEPSFIPPEIAEDGPILRTALSAADFNRRFIHRRPNSFLDLHTNTSQVSKNTQPGRIRVQKNIKQDLNFRVVQEEVIPLKATDLQAELKDNNNEWLTTYDCSQPSRYPIAIYSLQKQDIVSL